jgi:formylglycine-generating enzyme required for sulfatase activity
MRRRKHPDRLIQRGKRLQHMQEQQRRLDAFLRLRDRLSPPALDVAGHIGRIRNGSMELQFSAINAGTLGSTIFIGTRPVTNAQYRAFIAATGYEEPPTWQRAPFRADDVPVTGVNWFEACAFAAWVGGSLPTEAEWVAAARGNDEVRRFATASGDINPTVACYGRPFGCCGPVAATTYRPNPEGYYGLCGNVWDWCASPWGLHQVIRGGGCMDAAAFCTIETRYRNAPIDRDCSVGFRVKAALHGTI